MTALLDLIRHADALPRPPTGTDLDRPLSPIGLRQALALGERIRDRGGYPDRVWCSPARRTRETLAALGYDFTSITTYDERIYEVDLDPLLDFLGEVRPLARRLLVVGHNPGLQDLLTYLAGPDVPEMQTATYVRIALPDRPMRPLRGKGKLVDTWAP